MAHQNPPIILQPGEQTLNVPAPLLPSQRTSVLCLHLLPVFAMWRNYLHSSPGKPGIQRITVVGFIVNHSIWLFIHEARFESRFHKDDFVWRSRFSVSGDRKTSAVDNGHDFRTFAPLGRSRFAPPFFGHHGGAIDKAR